MLLLFALACSVAPTDLNPDPEVPAHDDSPTDSEPPETYVGPAYTPCVTDAQCDAGSACTSVPGHGGLYCAPPCEPLSAAADLACELPGLPYATACMDNGRCARACGEPDTCPEALACQEEPPDGEEPLCAGPPFGASGNYGTCSHPQADGPDCPTGTSCFGGDYLGTPDRGVCVPWCDDGSCPAAPEDTVAVSPVCYDVGLPHPSCALICVPSASTCPEGQECFDLGFVGICAPEGANY